MTYTAASIRILTPAETADRFGWVKVVELAERYQIRLFQQQLHGILALKLPVNLPEVPPVAIPAPHSPNPSVAPGACQVPVQPHYRTLLFQQQLHGFSGLIQIVQNFAQLFPQPIPFDFRFPAVAGPGAHPAS